MSDEHCTRRLLPRFRVFSPNCIGYRLARSSATSNGSLLLADRDAMTKIRGWISRERRRCRDEIRVERLGGLVLAGGGGGGGGARGVNFPKVFIQWVFQRRDEHPVQRAMPIRRSAGRSKWHSVRRMRVSTVRRDRGIVS